MGKRKAEEIDADDEAKAEEELQVAIKAAAAASPNEAIDGLGNGKAPLYFKVAGVSPAPWEYPTLPQAGEKSLMFCYLAIRGMGEVPRLLLAEAGATYEHIACTMGETQPNSLEWRTRSPNGLVPMMSGLGVPRSAPLSQSGSIIRFLAGKYGMNGDDALEAARIDVLFESAKDLHGNKNMITGEESYDKSASKLPAKLSVCIEAMLENMQVADDDTKKMNYGQIQLFHGLQTCEEMKAGCVGKLSEKLEWFRKAMAARPRIAAYLASPMRFPLTCNELSGSGGYKYANETPNRSDFAK